jgi:hypothetical protein
MTNNSENAAKLLYINYSMLSDNLLLSITALAAVSPRGRAFHSCLQDESPKVGFVSGT